MTIRPVKIERMFKGMPRYEPEIMDSSAVMVFKECPRKYFYTIVLGFKEKEPPPYFAFGSALHKCMEVYFKQASLPFEERRKAAMNAAIEYHQKHISPLSIQPGSKWDFYTLERLMQSCFLLIQFFVAEEKLGQTKVIASEQIINTTLPDGSTRGGRSDQMLRWVGRLAGRDLKSTSQDLNYYERSLEPNDQFTGYTYIQTKLSGEILAGQFVLVVMNKKGTKAKDYKDGGPIIKQFLTTRSAYQLEVWEKDQVHWNTFMNSCRDNDNWPMNEKACYGCHFRKACSSGGEDGIKATLQTDFKVDPWDFTKIGEDE